MIRKLNILAKAGVGVTALGTILPFREQNIVPLMFIKLPETEGTWASAWDDAKTTTKRETKTIDFIAIDVKELVSLQSTAWYKSMHVSYLFIREVVVQCRLLKAWKKMKICISLLIHEMWICVEKLMVKRWLSDYVMQVVI